MTGNPGAADRGYDLPLPFGWFAVAKSEEIGAREVKPISYFNTEFVVWRGEDGGLRAVDPYCPHLGAHLGHGGKVIGDDLRCPFHHWSFNGQGGVTDIPYTKIVPPKLRKSCTPAWPVRESFGLIYVWYHPHKAEPLWEVASVPELDEDGWVELHSTEWVIPIHIQELTENSADYAHFRAVHDTKSPPIPTFRIDGFTRFSVVESKMETPRGLVDGKIETRATGPGQSFTRFYGISDILMRQTQTAIDGAQVHVRETFYHPPNISEGKARVTNALMRNLIFQVDQDIPIWTHKRYKREPMLVEGDGPILSYRKQYSQYYADAS